MPASEVSTQARVAAALRAAHICVRDKGAGLEELKDYGVCDSDPSWHVFDGLLPQDSKLWGLLCQFTDCQLQRPKRCQLAILFPEGRPEDEYCNSEDGRPQVDYHIDGRGRIPN